MFLTLTNTNYDHLLPSKTVMETQEWAEPLWNEKGGTGFEPHQKFMVGQKVIAVINVTVNKEWESLCLWLVEEGDGKTPFFKTGIEIDEAIKNNKIKII